MCFKKQNQAFSYNVLTGIYEFCTPKIYFSPKLLKAKKMPNGQRGPTMKQDAKWANTASTALAKIRLLKVHMSAKSRTFYKTKQTQFKQ